MRLQRLYPGIFIALVLLLSSTGSNALDIVPGDHSGVVFKLFKGLYYAHTSSEEILTHDRAFNSSNLSLGSCVNSQVSPITRSFLEAQFTLFAQDDAVWSAAFLDSLLITYNGIGKLALDATAALWIDASPISRLYVPNALEGAEFKNTEVIIVSEEPAPGPYLIYSSSETLSFDPVHRLYADEYQAFVFGAIADSTRGGWTSTNISLSVNGANHQYIPIPSRVPLLSSSLPLAGKRFALKDNFDAKGLQTSVGSLAYAKVHPLSVTTAPSVERLVSLGAVLVGKTRTSQFTHGANPWEFVDFPYSWNPRGDGFLTAASSSSGSACAIAAYDWLDFTIGSDTRGSVRKPASLVGVFGIRPTIGTMDMSGVVPLAVEMDTIGFFARDPLLFDIIGRLW